MYNYYIPTKTLASYSWSIWRHAIHYLNNFKKPSSMVANDGMLAKGKSYQLEIKTYRHCFDWGGTYVISPAFIQEDVVHWVLMHESGLQ